MAFIQSIIAQVADFGAVNSLLALSNGTLALVVRYIWRALQAEKAEGRRERAECRREREVCRADRLKLWGHIQTLEDRLNS